jgi:hypothetical protein
MPGFLLHVMAGIKCPHQIPALVAPAQSRVFVSGMLVATMPAKVTVAGCPFTVPGPKPQPCVGVQWQMPSTRVLVMGQPAMLQATPGPGAGICFSPGPPPGIPNGPPVVEMMQMRVLAT